MTWAFRDTIFPIYIAEPAIQNLNERERTFFRLAKLPLTPLFTDASVVNIISHLHI